MLNYAEWLIVTSVSMKYTASIFRD